MAEIGRWVATDFMIELAEDAETRDHASGVTREHAPSRAKAANLHGMRIADVPGGVEADITLWARVKHAHSPLS